MPRSALLLAVVVATLAGSTTAAAAPIPPHIKITGASCNRALLVQWDIEDPLGFGGAPWAQHALDDQWVHLDVTRTDQPNGARKLDVRWSLDPGLAICRGSWTHLVAGTHAPIRTTDGERSGEVRAGFPAGAKVKARFTQKIELREDLGRRKLRRLVAGWARRGCELREEGSAGARLLESLATRSGAHDCKPPKRLRPTLVQLLHHAVAHFNNLGVRGSKDVATEYYRVLAQLTTFRPPS